MANLSLQNGKQELRGKPVTAFRPSVGEKLAARRFQADTVQLFLYNAAIWNPHRIHFDLPYAQEKEGHPQLLVDGPLQGDWLTQVVEDWAGEEGEIIRFGYSNRRSAYVGEVLTASGFVSAFTEDCATVSLQLGNERGEVTTIATATVQFCTTDKNRKTT